MQSEGRKIAIALLRRDLRLHDHPIFSQISSAKIGATHVLPVYCFDGRQSGSARGKISGVFRMGSHRTRFLIESLSDLSKNLKQVNSNLLVMTTSDIPKSILSLVDNLLSTPNTSFVGLWISGEAASEEVTTEQKLRSTLGNKCPVNILEPTLPLVHPKDLPFEINKMPDIYTEFRKRVEGLEHMYRPLLPTPTHLKPFPSFDKTDDISGWIGTDVKFDDLQRKMLSPLVNAKTAGCVNVDSTNINPKSAFTLKGGETAALDRLDDYTRKPESYPREVPLVASYKETRNGMLGLNYSSKFSAHLALGCLSPRKIAQTVEELEQELESAVKDGKIQRNKVPAGRMSGTYWLIFELLWRDFMFFLHCKYGDAFFKPDGMLAMKNHNKAQEKVKSWRMNKKGLEAWYTGTTGVPLIDACQRELVATGYMSNRGRQNVASFLTKDLQIDWRYGAEFFEQHLIDHDVSSNSGNWQYQAGVGSDPREDRRFNPIKQAGDYDANGDYVRHWIPELSSIPGGRVHVPWILSENTHGYPRPPIVEENSWKSFYSRSNKKGGDKGKHRK